MTDLIIKFEVRDQSFQISKNALIASGPNYFTEELLPNNITTINRNPLMFNYIARWIDLMNNEKSIRNYKLPTDPKLLQLLLSDAKFYQFSKLVLLIEEENNKGNKAEILGILHKIKKIVATNEDFTDINFNLSLDNSLEEIITEVNKLNTFEKFIAVEKPILQFLGNSFKNYNHYIQKYSYFVYKHFIENLTINDPLLRLIYMIIISGYEYNEDAKLLAEINSTSELNITDIFTANDNDDPQLKSMKNMASTLMGSLGGSENFNNILKMALNPGTDKLSVD